jgi:hypothetical protein
MGQKRGCEMETLEAYCKAAGWQGGTIHQAKIHFSVIPLKEQDSICGFFVNNMSKITDLREVSYFMAKRNENYGLEMVSLQHSREVE